MNSVENMEKLEQLVDFVWTSDLLKSSDSLKLCGTTKAAKISGEEACCVFASLLPRLTGLKVLNIRYILAEVILLSRF